MISTIQRARRATAFLASLLFPPALIAYGIHQGWGLGEWMAAWGGGSFVAYALVLLAL